MHAAHDINGPTYTLAIKLLVYGTLIVLVVGGRPGGRLVRAVAAIPLGSDLAEAIYVHIAPSPLLMATLFLSSLRTASTGTPEARAKGP